MGKKDRPTAPGSVAAEADATIGDGTLVEQGVTVGFRYHPQSGPARIGKNCILRMGTIIYGDVTIGDYFQTGHYAVIRARVEIGDYCTVLNHSALEGLIRMGRGVRIMSNVYIPSRTWFGDNVFVGPGVTFLNDRQPGRVERMETPRGATVEDDVMIGGGCTIMAGITIGQRSFIAAGTMVTRDVPPRSLVMGVPGRIQPLPEKLDMPNNHALTLQPLDLWHPRGPDPQKIPWPWPE
jgi:acetyltransferase-like isoleucine patch superfamily enzyme